MEKYRRRLPPGSQAPTAESATHSPALTRRRRSPTFRDAPSPPLPTGSAAWAPWAPTAAPPQGCSHRRSPCPGGYLREGLGRQELRGTAPRTAGCSVLSQVQDSAQCPKHPLHPGALTEPKGGEHKNLGATSCGTISLGNGVPNSECASPPGPVPTLIAVPRPAPLSSPHLRSLQTRLGHHPLYPPPIIPSSHHSVWSSAT